MRMAVTLIIIIIVIGSVLFHFVSPWWTNRWPRTGSSGRYADDHADSHGHFFVVINLFLAYTLLRYRRREGRRAA